MKDVGIGMLKNEAVMRLCEGCKARRTQDKGCFGLCEGCRARKRAGRTGRMRTQVRIRDGLV